MDCLDIFGNMSCSWKTCSQKPKTWRCNMIQLYFYRAQSHNQGFLDVTSKDLSWLFGDYEPSWSDKVSNRFPSRFVVTWQLCSRALSSWYPHWCKTKSSLTWCMLWEQTGPLKVTWFDHWYCGFQACYSRYSIFTPVASSFHQPFAPLYDSHGWLYLFSYCFRWIIGTTWKTLKNTHLSIWERNFSQICADVSFFQSLDKKHHYICHLLTSNATSTQVPTNSFSKAKLLSSTFSGLSPPWDWGDDVVTWYCWWLRNPKQQPGMYETL